jgi:hypothetical protein
LAGAFAGMFGTVAVCYKILPKIHENCGTSKIFLRRGAFQIVALRDEK